MQFLQESFEKVVKTAFWVSGGMFWGKLDILTKTIWITSGFPEKIIRLLVKVFGCQICILSVERNYLKKLSNDNNIISLYFRLLIKKFSGILAEAFPRFVKFAFWVSGAMFWGKLFVLKKKYLNIFLLSDLGRKLFRHLWEVLRQRCQFPFDVSRGTVWEEVFLTIYLEFTIKIFGLWWGKLSVFSQKQFGEAAKSVFRVCGGMFWGRLYRLKKNIFTFGCPEKTIKLLSKVFRQCCQICILSDQRKILQKLSNDKII